ncbi:MAG: shikimate dehydrogenase [Polyangiales bacterium]
MTDPIRLGIFGYPVAHSKSPEMHGAAAQAVGIQLEYERFEVAPEQLAQAVADKHRAGIDGYNVTVPHKQAVMEMLDDVAHSARTIGAVNTVLHADGRYVGHNTDALGLVRALVDAQVPLEDARVVVLGAGGAARAAVVGLAEAGASEIAVLARRPEQSEALADSLVEALDCVVEGAALSDAQWHFDSASLVVQATSATLGTNPRAAEFSAMLPIDALPDDAAVIDMVYKPLETTVLRAARARGLKGVDGLGMLLHQGAIAFEMWTGQRPPLDVMRRALGD